MYRRHFPRLPRRKLYRALIVTAVAAVFLSCALYWVFLQRTQQRWMDAAEDQARLRAQQLSSALATQVSTLLSGLDYVTRDLAVTYAAEEKGGFLAAVQSVRDTFPEGSIMQIAVADQEGVLRYASPGSAREPAPSGPPPRVSVADRGHFQVHRQSADAGLYISQPVMGRVSGQWAIVFSRGIRSEGEFLGVATLSVSPDYLARAFRQVMTSDDDVAMLLRDDGSYLARSREQDRVLGTRVPVDREFLTDASARSGEYVAQAGVDGVPRYYAWHRIEHYPLVLSLGLGQHSALAQVAETISSSRSRNLVSIGLILCAALLIGRLALDRQRQLERTAASREQLQLALYGGSLGLWDWELPIRRVAFNAQWAEMLGYRPQDLSDDSAVIERLTHPDDWPKVWRQLRQHLKNEIDHFASEHRMRHRDGHWVWVLAHGRVTHRDERGRALRMVGTHRDVSARRLAEEGMAATWARLQAVIEHFRGGVLVVDEHEAIVSANRSLITLLHLDTTPEALTGQPRAALLPLLPPGAYETVFGAAGTAGADAGAEVCVLPQAARHEAALPDGQVLEVERIPAMHQGVALGWMWLLRDITDTRRRQAQLEALASTDTLTGLPNRRAFMAHLEHELGELGRQLALGELPANPGVVIMLDLDHFKRVNDSHGHAVGDEVLCHLAAVLQAVLRRGDVPGRLGGEEFAILLPRADAAGAMVLAERIRARLADTPAQTRAGPITVTASLGLCLLHTPSAQEVLARADAALYEAKHQGRNRVVAWGAYPSS